MTEKTVAPSFLLPIKNNKVMRGERRERKMQQLIQIGDKIVPANENLKDISLASKEITDVAEKYKTDVLAVICKEDGSNIVAQHREERIAELIKDIAKILSIIKAIADTYKVTVTDIVDAIKFITEKGKQDDEE